MEPERLAGIENPALQRELLTQPALARKLLHSPELLLQLLLSSGQ